MNRRIRLIPIVIFGAAFMATLKLGSVIQGVGGLVAATSAAESGAQEEPAAAQDGPNKGATTKEIRVAGKAAEKSSDAGEPGADDAKDKVKKKGEWVDPAAMTGAELEVLQRLSARRKVLDKRAKELELRRNLLQATERRVDTKVAELKQIQATINALLRRHSKQKEEQMRSVVKIYENMKPKDAARILASRESRTTRFLAPSTC